MRIWIVTIVGLGILVVAGCSNAHYRTIHDEPAIACLPATLGAELASALLFDPVPGRYRASDFACRSDWPSTVSFYSPGQIIYFSDWVYDRQGRTFGESDYTFRQSSSVRAGVGVKP